MHVEYGRKRAEELSFLVSPFKGQRSFCIEHGSLLRSEFAGRCFFFTGHRILSNLYWSQNKLR